MASKNRRFASADVWVFVLSLAIAAAFFIPAHFQLTGSLPQTGSNYLNRPLRASEFDWVGYLQRNPARQFTQAEVNELAMNNEYVVIPKFHAGYDRALQDADAIAIKTRRHDTKVLMYVSGRYVFILEHAPFAELGFQDDWYLRAEVGEHTGKKVPQDLQDWEKDDTKKALFVDMSNPDLRRWIREQYVAGRFASAPYDGIAFDSARRIGEGNNTNVWLAILTPEKIDAWNTGLVSLLSETRAAYPSKFIVFNGVGNVAQTPNRGLDLLTYTNGALNEWFCLKPAPGGNGQMMYMTSDEVAEELNLVEQYGRTDKTLFLRVDFEESKHGASLERSYTDIGRYCFGMFSLVNRTGRSYFKMGSYAINPDSFRYPRETAVRLGAPLGKAVTRLDTLFTREFQNGFVAVNAGPSQATVTLPSSSSQWRRVNGNMLSSLHGAGSSVIIPPNDAVFFVREQGGSVQ